MGIMVWKHRGFGQLRLDCCETFFMSGSPCPHPQQLPQWLANLSKCQGELTKLVDETHEPMEVWDRLWGLHLQNCWGLFWVCSNTIFVENVAQEFYVVLRELAFVSGKGRSRILQLFKDRYQLVEPKIRTLSRRHMPSRPLRILCIHRLKAQGTGYSEEELKWYLPNCVMKFVNGLDSLASRSRCWHLLPRACRAVFWSVMAKIS